MNGARARSDADVIVAGAGPAGAAVATRLARAGQRVLLLDRERFPRDKVCGDYVGPLAVAELAELGVTFAGDDAPGNPVRTAAVYVDGERLITRALPSAGGGVEGRVVPRALLDAAIVRCAAGAGATLLEAHTVSGYETGRNGVVVHARHDGAERRFRARLLIGADGSASAVARALRGTAHPKRDTIIALRAYYDGVAGPADRCDLHFHHEAWPGYSWLFPTTGGAANVGIGMVVTTFPAPERHLRDVLLGLVQRDASLRRRLRKASLRGPIVGWPLATYNPGLPLVGDRVMLVGDAAGLINPINGEGIQYALSSARWAAATALPALQKKNGLGAAVLRGYAERVDAELHYDMALARLIVRVISNRRFSDVWLASLKRLITRAGRDEPYAQVAGGILAGIVPAREALRARSLAMSAEAVLGAAVSALVTRARSASAGAGGNGAPGGGWLADRPVLTRWLGECMGDAFDLANEVAKSSRARH